MDVRNESRALEVFLKVELLQLSRQSLPAQVTAYSAWCLRAIGVGSAAFAQEMEFPKRSRRVHISCSP